MSDEPVQTTDILQQAESITAAAKPAQGDKGQPKPRVGADLTETVLAKTQAKEDSGRGEISAATLGRMLGLVTSAELRVLEGKIDLMASRVNNLGIRMDKVIASLSGMPSGSDLERIDVQLGQIRAMIAGKSERPEE